MSTTRNWLWAISVPILCFVGQILCDSPAPRFLGMVTEVLLWFAVFTVFLVIYCVIASIYFVVLGFTRRKQGELLSRLSKSLACLCFITLWFAALLSGEFIRHRAFVRASAVGDRVAQALAQYKVRTGGYPEDLSALVPDYLSEIPYTGMIAYPQFAYMKDHNDLQVRPGTYELRINCPSGGINFDRFIYWPSENYPKRIQGKPVERIRGWAYVHE